MTLFFIHLFLYLVLRCVLLVLFVFWLQSLKDQSENVVIRECLLLFKHGAKESATKPANVVETEATTFSTDSPRSVTADDCSQT